MSLRLAGVAVCCALIVANAGCRAVGGNPPTQPGPGVGAGTATGAGASAPLPAGDSRQSMSFEGRERTWIVHVPNGFARVGSDPLAMPLLVVLHGGGGNAAQMPKFTGFSEISDRNGFVVAYPDGVGHNWNDGRDSDFSQAHALQVNDVGFVSALIDQTSKQISIDSSRIYATGISNGAMMSLRLACDLGNRIAAIGAVAGSGPEDFMERCKPSRAVSILMINGTTDPLVPYEGGPVASQTGERGSVWPVRRTVSFWVAANRCVNELTPEALVDLDAGDGSAIERRIWSGCSASTSVELLTVVGGGHTYPGRIQYLPEIVIGPTNRDIDASAYIWDFLRNHPLDPSVTPTTQPADSSSPH